mmetsp:Transcript_17728/g.58005  ORF Transcript_17728/g.58005 Transcript_17728/m.58005 type:complete len:247 (-) Transcript_17728:654-1394(-)
MPRRRHLGRDCVMPPASLNVAHVPRIPSVLAHGDGKRLRRAAHEVPRSDALRVVERDGEVTALQHEHGARALVVREPRPLGVAVPRVPFVLRVFVVEPLAVHVPEVGAEVAGAREAHKNGLREPLPGEGDLRLVLPCLPAVAAAAQRAVVRVRGGARRLVMERQHPMLVARAAERGPAHEGAVRARKGLVHRGLAPRMPVCRVELHNIARFGRFAVGTKFLGMMENMDGGAVEPCDGSALRASDAP